MNKIVDILISLVLLIGILASSVVLAAFVMTLVIIDFTLKAVYLIFD